MLIPRPTIVCLLFLGGEFILTEKEGGRQSNLQDLVIAFAQEWPGEIHLDSFRHKKID